MIRHLDLFSGIGGFALAARMVGGVETVGFCEIDPWARRVLAKNFPGVPAHDDVTTLKGIEYGTVDLITGGYPCQPFSTAGQRRGAADDRHLWPEMRRIINQARPRYVLAENVAGHVTMGFDAVLSEMEGDGYACGAVVIPAVAVDAPHRRDRVWIMGHANRQRLDRCIGAGLTTRSRAATPAGPLHAGHPSCRTTPRRKWAPEPRVGRVANGVPNRTHRLRGLGNAIVPQVAAELLRVMLHSKDV